MKLTAYRHNLPLISMEMLEDGGIYESFIFFAVYTRRVHIYFFRDHLLRRYTFEIRIGSWRWSKGVGGLRSANHVI